MITMIDGLTASLLGALALPSAWTKARESGSRISDVARHKPRSLSDRPALPCPALPCPAEEEWLGIFIHGSVWAVVP